MRVLDRPPLHFRVAVSLPFGRHKACSALRMAGLLAGEAPFLFHDKHVLIPLDHAAVWTNPDFTQYQIRRVRAFAGICDAEMPSYDLLDCGAHLGLVSAQFLRHSRNVRQVIAIEPNSGINALTLHNIRAGGNADIHLIKAAVADFSGRASLQSPDYDLSDEGKYIREDPEGDFEVIKIADLAPRVGMRLAIKLDIEGSEVPAMRAASSFLRSRERVVVMVEVHRDVLARLQTTPSQFLGDLNEACPFRWFDAGDASQEIDVSRDIWEQTGQRRQVDLIGVSISP
jgi:FkbM family methyltransferase